MATNEMLGARKGGRMVGEKRRRRTRLILFAGLMFAASVALVLVFVDFSRFELPSDFHERYLAGEVEQGETLHLGGYVAQGSFETRPDAEIRFVITDTVHTVPVRYLGVRPDLLTEGQGVVADGEWVGDRETGYLRATRVLAKHDENYQPPQLIDALAERGLPTDGVE